MTAVRRANAGGSVDGLSISSGTVREALPVVQVGLDGSPLDMGIGTLGVTFLGTSGATATIDGGGSTTNTANNTTARYAQVPAGKIWRVKAIKAFILDTDNSAGTLLSFGSQSAPSAGTGLRIRTVDTNGTTALVTLAASIESNAGLLLTFGAPPSAFTPASHGTTLLLVWNLTTPAVITAGQRIEVKHLASVAYTVGAFGIEYEESTA